MPARGRTDSLGANASRRSGLAYGILAAAWLLILAASGLAGWYVHTNAQTDPRVRTAVLHAGDLPAAPEPATATAGDDPEAIDPRVLQLAARESLLSTPEPADRATTGTAAPQPPKQDTPTTAREVADRSPTRASNTATRAQIAARTHVPASGSAASGPMPPPIPRSVITSVNSRASDAARYSVQVGAFRLRENAVERATRLSEAGYEMRIVHLFATHSRLYMVRLGDFDARPAAMAYAQRLSRDVGVETWPVRN
jgi:cell division protein FtsN